MKVYKGEDFQRIRLNAGLSMGKMADLLGVNQKSIYNWENNISSPPELHLNVYQRLDEKIKIYKSQNNKEPINNTLKQILVFGGITAILVWLFKEK